MNDENLAQLEKDLNAAFAALDRELDPTFQYVDMAEPSHTKKASK
jgi:1-acyl-sn-glycerol-3-phosphate acyltransferase